jgi:hypothetical protein
MPLSNLRGLGSFAGVRFHITESGIKSGFHNKALEFVSDHPPEPQLYGKKPREFSLSGFLIGIDRNLAKDLFFRACDRAKPQRLFLPSFGFFLVYCTSFDISEKMDEWGTYTLAFSFLEVPQAPIGLFSGVLEAASQFDDLVNSFAESMLGTLEVMSLHIFGVQKIAATLGKIHALVGSTSNGLGFFLTAPFASMEEVARALLDLAASPGRLMHTLKEAVPTLSAQNCEKLAKLPSPFGEFFAMSSLQDQPMETRRTLFEELSAKLPPEQALQLVQAAPEIFREKQKVPDIPTGPGLSILLAFGSGDLSKVDEIAKVRGTAFGFR